MLKNNDLYYVIVVILLFNLPLLVLLQLQMSSKTTAENYSFETLQKCSFWEKIFRNCRKNANEIITTTTPSVIIKEDEESKNLGFSFSAFVITLFASLAIALTGAFACWCCRTFCRHGSFISHHHPRSITPPPSIHNNNGVALEPLVDDHTTNHRRNYRRTNSLPSYSNVISSGILSPSAPPHEEPPPSYASLFGSNLPENKS